MREVRFSLVPSDCVSARITNSWAGWPASGALAPHLTLRALVGGPVDPRTGYLVNIALIDRVLREAAVAMLQRRLADAGPRPLHPAGLMRRLWTAAAGGLGDFTLEELELGATPYLRFAINAGDLSMVTITQSFEFAAAHRLCVPGLSDAENRRIFGKCANPNGHGHNYVLEVTVAGRPDPANGTVIDLPAFESTVKERVIDRFDHRHLNADCAEFAHLNPTVENITRVIWDLLVDAFDRCRLHAVRVWETPKTFAECRGE